MKNKKEITEEDMEIIERKIDAINIKMINWKVDILNRMYRARNTLSIIFAILIISLIIAIIN
jgi:hypothetical protein